MKLRSTISKFWLRALVLPLAMGMHAGPAFAAGSNEPAAATTLDICQNDATGNWRYSGLVAVSNGAASDTSVMTVDYAVQNKVSTDVYNDVYHATQLAPPAMVATAAPAKILAYSIEAAPLILGEVRNVARIAMYDPLNAAAPAIMLQPSAQLIEAVCGCPPPKGCTRTQGYWGNKPDLVWPGLYERRAPFYSSSVSWQTILDTEPKNGNGYLILAHQYIAAVLNKASDASMPSGVKKVLDQAAEYFASGTTPDSCSGSQCATQKTWAGILDAYNNGNYPGGPPPCPD